MRNRDPRTFNIADAGGGTPPAGTDPVPPGGSPGADGAGAGAGADGGGTPAPAPAAFADWTPEALTPLIPDGFEVTPEQSSAIVDIVNQAKGDPGKIVGGLLSYYTKVSEQVGAQLAEQFNKTQTDWQNEMKADPTYGGAKFNENLAVAKETAARLGGNEFLELLRITGAGNSVHMLRFLMKAAEFMPKEGTPAGGRPAAQPKSLGDRLFGSPPNQQG